MKTFAIKRSYGYLEADSSEIDGEEHEQRIENLDRALKDLYEEHGFHFICSDTRFLNSKKISVRKCESCDSLMINRDKNPAGFDQSDLWADATRDTTMFIANGGTHDGKELCIDCLPADHRWGYFS